MLLHPPGNWLLCSQSMTFTTPGAYLLQFLSQVTSACAKAAKRVHTCATVFSHPPRCANTFSSTSSGRSIKDLSSLAPCNSARAPRGKGGFLPLWLHIVRLVTRKEARFRTGRRKLTFLRMCGTRCSVPMLVSCMPPTRALSFRFVLLSGPAGPSPGFLRFFPCFARCEHLRFCAVRPVRLARTSDTVRGRLCGGDTSPWTSPQDLFGGEAASWHAPDRVNPTNRFHRKRMT